MSGPAPKANRQRRNKTVTRAVLVDDKGGRIPPPLPKRKGRTWEPLTKEYWNSIWRSPQADKFLDVDLMRLYMFIEIVDSFWKDPSLDTLKEIRLQGQAFGLTPIDRLRLQWAVAEPDSETKSAGKSTVKGAKSLKKKDPRYALRLVTAR
jgi:hypothetical protein